MKLIQLSVENFGVLHEYSLDLNDGLNVFCRDNGAGKTTLAAFLCAMLYGLPATRKNDIADNDRKKYQPWQGGVFGGSMTFSVHGKTYRAERRFVWGNSAKNDTFALYDLSDNSRSDDFSENLGQELFGIDAASFERSIYLPQKNLSGVHATESITARLNRAIGGDTDDGAGLYKSAAAVLDRQRQYYAKQGGRGYIADLEAKVTALHEKEYEALRAKADAERFASDAAALDGEIAAIREKRQALGEEQTAAAARSAVLAHGKTLLDARDARLASAAEKRSFLHLDDESGIVEGTFGDAAVNAAKETYDEHRLLCDRLTAAEERIARIGGEQAKLDALFAGGIPDEETAAQITSDIRLLTADGTECASDAASAQLPACFSEEELSRHTEQVQMHARMTEILEQPKTAEEGYRTACQEAGISEADELPDDDTMQAYADVLGALAQNREKQAQLLPQIEQTNAAMAAFSEKHPISPEQQEIVAMRSRFDALRSRTEEIEELEARQRLAVQVHENLRRSRRVRIGVGAGLLFAAILLCVGYFLMSDSRLLIAGGVTALPGLILLILGLFTHPEESDEAMALEDAALKRLCTKKSEYEVEKAAIYEFLDRIGGDAEAVLDEREAAERFALAAATAREREALCAEDRSQKEQLDALTLEEARLAAVLSSYTKSGGGEIADIGDDRAVFSAYRRGVQTCRAALASYKEERETRAQAQARKNALEVALDRYLAELDASCPQTVQRCGDTEDGTYSARMTAWCRTADLLRMQMGQAQKLAEQKKATEQALSAQLDAMFSDGAQLPEISAEDTVIARAQAVISAIGRYRALADERAQLAEQRGDLRRRTEETEQILRTFLGGYFEEPLPSAADGLGIITEKTAALSSDMELLRESQRALALFLSGHGMTEDGLSRCLQNPDTAGDTAADALRSIDELLDQKTAQRAKILQDAQASSRTGSALSEIRGQLAAAEETLSAAKQALSVIRLTQKTLDDARAAMSGRYLAYMQARFREYWARLNGTDAQDAAKLSLDAAFSVQTEVFGERRDAAFFSRGTQDCIDFCVRLALIDAMFTDGGKKADAPHPPILLDDPFVNLDKTHLAAARHLLDDIAERFQILYFVCHESRM